jgi:hypothetical protein
MMKAMQRMKKKVEQVRKYLLVQQSIPTNQLLEGSMHEQVVRAENLAAPNQGSSGRQDLGLPTAAGPPAMDSDLQSVAEKRTSFL